MCNPRRIEVTLTRQVQEAWEREVERAAEVADTLTGEARIRQPLDAALGGPALMALQTLLANGFEGWTEDPDGSYRHPVEGGYVVYHPDERELEIVATVHEEVRETGSARERLSGAWEGEVETKGEGRYYDDGHGGHTEEKARRDAEKAAESTIADTVQERLAAEAEAAERDREVELTRQAEADARRRLEERAEALAPELQRRARERLEAVGIRGRQAFHRLLAHAYRDALVSLARRRGVANRDIVTNETDEYLELDFMLP